MSGTVTATQALRARVEARMGGHVCPTCQKPCGNGAMSLREAGEAAGLPATVLHRFLRGKAISSDTFDVLHAWVSQ